MKGCDMSMLETDREKWGILRTLFVHPVTQRWLNAGVFELVPTTSLMGSVLNVERRLQAAGNDCLPSGTILVTRVVTLSMSALPYPQRSCLSSSAG
jgi:hypothetical protein